MPEYDIEYEIRLFEGKIKLKAESFLDVRIKAEETEDIRRLMDNCANTTVQITSIRNTETGETEEQHTAKAGDTPPPGAPMKYSADGGLTWQDAPQGVRIIYHDQPVPGEDEPGELHLNATTEGLIADVWVTREEHLDHNIGTSSETAEEMIARMIEDNA